MPDRFVTYLVTMYGQLPGLLPNLEFHCDQSTGQTQADNEATLGRELIGLLTRGEHPLLSSDRSIAVVVDLEQGTGRVEHGGELVGEMTIKLEGS